MRQDQKIILILKAVIHLPHIIIEPGANSFAGCKKVFSYIDFTRHILVGKPVPVLVGKGKWTHITDGRHLRTGKAGYQFG